MSEFGQVTFERTQVRSETSDRVQALLTQGHSCLVRGPDGSGKSHAVRDAVNGAVWVDLAPRPFTVPRFVSSLALQLDESAGRSVLEAAAVGDTLGSLELAGQALADRVLVVDAAEHIARSSASPFEDPTETMFVSEAQDLMGWIRARFDAKPTVVVTSRRLSDFGETNVDHKTPEWPVKLVDSKRGFYFWKEAADLLWNRPAGLQVAAAAAELVAPERFNGVVEDLQWSEELTPTAALSAFTDLALEAMSGPWLRALAVHAAIEGAPAPLRDSIIASSSELRSSTRALTELRLIDAERGFVHVSAPLTNHPSLAQVEGARDVLREAARHLQDGINDASALDPRDANAIFLAHRLYVRLGDFDAAARTARLHRGGLIALARQVSLDGRWDEARRLYEHISSLLPEPTSEATRRTRSYVVHYRAYNGHRARTLANGEVLSGYEESTELWTDNALWWKRRLCLLIELGRLDEFRAALAEAEHEVPAHKRKDGLLRVPAAVMALDVGEALMSLELLEAADTSEDPQGAAMRSDLQDRFDRGVDVERLQASGLSIVLNQPEALRVRYVRDGAWQAAWLDRVVVRASAAASLRAIVEETASHVRRLVETPTHLLEEREIFEKGRIIGRVDLGASEIGLWAARERWLLGRRSGDVFRPQQAELEAVELPATMRGEDAGLFFARVPVSSDGRPNGPVEELVPAGSGRRLDELLDALKALRSAS